MTAHGRDSWLDGRASRHEDDWEDKVTWAVENGIYSEIALSVGWSKGE